MLAAGADEAVLALRGCCFSALTEQALSGLSALPHVRVIGGKTAGEHHGILAFLVEGVHPHDVSAILNDDRVAVRV